MMKNKRIVLLALVLSLCLGLLAGCGGKAAEGEDPGKAEEPAQSTETPEYIYVPEYIALDTALDNGIDRMIRCGDRFLISSYAMIADNTPEGVVPEYEGQYWEYGYKFYWLDMDGSLTPLDHYTSMPLPEGTDKQMGNAWVSDVTMAPDGGIITLDCININHYDGPDDIEMYSDEWYEKGYSEYMTYEENYYIRKLNADGSEQSILDLSALSKRISEENGYFYTNGFEVDAEGNYYLLCDTRIFVLDSEGNELFVVESENWFDNMFSNAEGKVGVTCYEEDSYAIRYVDTAAKALGEPIKCAGRDMYSLILGGGDYDAYYTNGSNFFGLDLTTGEQTKLLNWINSDVDTNNMNTGNINVLDDGRIVAVESEWEENSRKCNNSLIVLSKKPYSSVPQRTRITYATQYLDYEIRSNIINFNKSNPDYRIEVLDYSEYNTEDDYSAGLTKLTAEITAGKVPDVIDLNGMPFDEFTAKGLLEDLYPYLDNDPELSRDDLFPSVLKALEKDGKLFRTAASFGISTVVGASSVVGDKPGWTLDEFKAALATMPEGCQPFDEWVTRDQILSSGLSMEMDNLIDWTTGQCNFNTPTFTRLLEFAAEFPETFDNENYDWKEAEETDVRISSGKQMLLMTSISDFQSFRMYQALFGGDITYIGFPTEQGVGNMLQINDNGCAISSKCENKDAAWQFVRTMFTEKYQSKNTWAFPTNKAAFNKVLEEAMTPEWRKDANGNFVLDENGEKIEESQGGWGWGSITVEMYSVKQEEADEILDLINNTTRVQKFDQDIYDIVNEEAAAFFAGQKSVDDVARLIQSKVNIVVNEKR